MTWVELVTLGAVAAPLIALAGSAVTYVYKAYGDRSDARRKHFFELMSLLDSNLSIASKMAAVYNLREYTEHAEFIYRFCNEQIGKIDGPAAASLDRELKETADYMGMRVGKND